MAVRKRGKVLKSASERGVYPGKGGGGGGGGVRGVSSH